jgi:hypothetical protein
MDGYASAGLPARGRQTRPGTRSQEISCFCESGWAGESRRLGEPLSIRVADLRSGAGLWSKAIRDTEFRGPFPQ